MQNPKENHMEAAWRVLQYLKGNSGQGILMRSNSDLPVSAIVILIGERLLFLGAL